MNNKEKYLKYKSKYTNLLLNSFNGRLHYANGKYDQIILPNTQIYLKKHNIINSLIGGYNRNFQTIPNNGYFNESFSNQCFWMSLYDYLSNYSGFDGNIINLRYLGELYDDSDHNMFDTFNERHLEAAERVAIHFNIRINFFSITDDSMPRDIMILNGRRYAVPREIINPHGRNIVDIAWSGGHFELIMNGPTRIQHSMPHREIVPDRDTIDLDPDYENQYVHKVYMPDNYLYKSKDELSEKELLYYTLQLDLINTNDQIYAAKQQIINIPKNLEATRRTLENMDRIGLSEAEKEQLTPDLIYNIVLLEEKLKAETTGLVELERLRTDITERLFSFRD